MRAMLSEEVKRFTELSGEDGYDTSIERIGAWLDGYDKAKAEIQWIPCDKKLPNEDEMYYNGVGIDGVRKVSDRVLAIDSKGVIRCGYFISSMWDHPYHGAGRIVNCYTDPLRACWEFGEHYQQDPENWIVGGKGDIVAWMPLPEPWKGGEK